MRVYDDIVRWLAIRDRFDDWREDAAEYCRGRSAWVRGAFTLYLVYAGIRHLADPMYRSWFGGITLVFHEMGHIVFSPFGRTSMLLGGSIMQLLVPLVAALYLLVKQRDWFGLAVGQTWLSFSAWDLATYVGDANKENLPLVSLGGTPEHDWSTLLTQWHLLNACDTLAAALRAFAFTLWIVAMALAIWLVVTMARAPNVPPRAVQTALQ